MKGVNSLLLYCKAQKNILRMLVIHNFGPVTVGKSRRDELLSHFIALPLQQEVGQGLLLAGTELLCPTYHHGSEYVDHVPNTIFRVCSN